MRPKHMEPLAELLARVLVCGEEPEHVLREVVAFRRQFQALHFVR